MIRLFDSKETNFNHNERVLKDALSCYVKEEANEMYELELEYPINDIAKELVEGKIIKAPTSRGGQLFRIYKPIKTLKTYKVYARHIFYDLLDNFIEDSRPTNMSGAGALNTILSAAEDPHTFSSLSDIAKVNTSYLIRKNVVQAIMGNDENSFLNRWGGEIVRDNFIIKILENGGSDRGYEVRLGKNLIGVEEEIDISEVTTKLYPTIVLENNKVYALPEKYVVSPLINKYHHPIIREVRIDLTDEQKEMTKENLYPMMRLYCLDLFEKNNIDKPKVNYKVDFIELSKTEQYKELSILEQIDIYDEVSVIVDSLNINVKAKVIKTVYDSLKNRYVSIELGQFKKGFSDTVKDVIEQVKQEIEINKSDLEKAIENATNLITSALGGYVVKREGEILIMDTENPNTATKVWRWNLNGLGYSGNGVNGPYRLAMTMDGSIVADFITTGVLNASLIKTGLIKPQVGDDFINMENGHFKLGGMEQDEDGFRVEVGGKDVETNLNAAINSASTANANANTAISDAYDASQLADSAESIALAANDKANTAINNLSGKADKANIRTQINANESNVLIASKNINLVGAVTVLSDLTSYSSLGNIYAGRMQGPGMDINLNTGKLSVSNSNGQVIIDGSSNMFKIAVDQSLAIDGATQNNYTRMWAHGLNYTPAYKAYQINIDVASGSAMKGSIELPAFSIGLSQPLNIGSAIRISVDSTYVYINYIRSNRSDYPRRIYVRFYLFKEALL